MCGIAGVVGDPSRKRAETAVRSMTTALARRGPNSEGLEAWDFAVLGHRRLSIFDLSDAGKQPMLSPDRSVAVVYNGAIYNFLQLRQDLEQRGFQFRSQTDTEVLIHGYAAWGFDGLVARLHGMFAIGLWDDKAQRLYLVRDRLGVKPLVYALRNGVLAFASTVRALRAAGFAEELDDQAVVEFLEFGYVTDARTIFQGVRKVQAATIVEWHDGRIQSREYWRPNGINESAAVSFEDAVEETERLFLRAVEMRLQADVPVGALLSGGVDSSLVCWATAKLGGDIKAFTVGTPGDPMDESEDARKTAAELGIRHCVLTASATDESDLDDLVSAFGEPFACGSALGMLKVSKAVREEATVLLTGDGGDDVFLGYPEHRHFAMAQRLARTIPGPFANLWRTIRGESPDSGWVRRGKHFMDYATGGLGSVVRAHDGLPMYGKNQLLGERLAHCRLPQREIPDSIESARQLLTRFLEHDRNLRFVGEYLTKVDGATMYYALEARSPFLDQDLWQFAASLPYAIRLRGGKLKAVLRELARRRVGARVAQGRKRGFGIPVHRWLAGRWRPLAQAAFQDSVLERQGWIRSAPVLQQLEHAGAAGIAPHQLWYLLVLEHWMRRNLAPAMTAVEPVATR
jgi:asparagine synthase (glutamine-hydrolysing)